ncbi:unnamed protein product [Nippostrongylus brasiliensis]|uniref:SCP domain-containing protein n=1 Tax=Nippostrongylus brasiliensis TaxID=27835 RepID=A0A0N4YC90_NIPBR|nr:unnamed protein product [Nippostrongylus brasiliensis]
MKFIIAVLLLTPAIVSAKFLMDNYGACGISLDLIKIYRDFATNYKRRADVDLKPACELMELGSSGARPDKNTWSLCSGRRYARSMDPHEILRKFANGLGVSLTDKTLKTYGCGFRAEPFNITTDSWNFCCYISFNEY